MRSNPRLDKVVVVHICTGVSDTKCYTMPCLCISGPVAGLASQCICIICVCVLKRERQQNEKSLGKMSRCTPKKMHLTTVHGAPGRLQTDRESETTIDIGVVVVVVDVVVVVVCLCVCLCE